MEARDFEALYDHIAQGLLSAGLPKDGSTLLPLFVIGSAAGGAVSRVEVMSMPPMMLTRAGRPLLNKMLDDLYRELEQAGDTSTCLAVVTEALALKRTDDGPVGDLASHPDTKETVLVTMMRPEARRIGMLPILPGRTLEYRPLVGSAGSQEAH